MSSGGSNVFRNIAQSIRQNEALNKRRTERLSALYGEDRARSMMAQSPQFKTNQEAAREAKMKFKMREERKSASSTNSTKKRSMLGRS